MAHSSLQARYDNGLAVLRNSLTEYAGQPVIDISYAPFTDNVLFVSLANGDFVSITVDYTKAVK